jgi:hypothetical protein
MAAPATLSEKTTMALLEPDQPYGWHDGHATWREIKVAVALALTVALAAILLF